MAPCTGEQGARPGDEDAAEVTLEMPRRRRTFGDPGLLARLRMRSDSLLSEEDGSPDGDAGLRVDPTRARWNLPHHKELIEAATTPKAARKDFTASLAKRRPSLPAWLSRSSPAPGVRRLSLPPWLSKDQRHAFSSTSDVKLPDAIGEDGAKMALGTSGSSWGRQVSKESKTSKDGSEGPRFDSEANRLESEGSRGLQRCASAEKRQAFQHAHGATGLPDPSRASFGFSRSLSQRLRSQGCFTNCLAYFLDCVLPPETRFVIKRTSSSMVEGGDESVTGQVQRSFSNSPQMPLRLGCLLKLHEVRGCNRGIREFYEPVDGLLGSGAYASVRKYRSIMMGYDGVVEEVAVKFIKWTKVWNGLLRDTSQEELVHREMKMLMILDNPFIIRVREWFEDFRGVYFVMELCDGGSLQDLLEEVCTVPCKKERVKWYDARLRRHFREITYALQYLHSLKPPIAHCDLKPANALLKTKDPGSCVKLIDFGLVSFANKRDRFDKWGKGTQIFMAPEQFLHVSGKFTTHIDIWALGIIFSWTITAIELGSLQHPMLEQKEGVGWEPTFQDLYHAYQIFIEDGMDCEGMNARRSSSMLAADGTESVEKKKLSKWNRGSEGSQAKSNVSFGTTVSATTSVYRERSRWNRSLFGDQPHSAFNLADRLLAYPPRTRWSARRVLNSAWVAEGSESLGECGLLTQESVFMNMRVYPSLSKFEQTLSMLVATRVSAYTGSHAEVIHQLKDAFLEFDANHDGMLDKAEITEAFRKAELHKIEWEDFSCEMDYLFQKLAKPSLSYTEWLAITIGAAVLGSEEAVSHAFRQIDAGNKGYISRADLANSVSDEDAGAILAEMGKDPENGSVSYEEFRKLALRAASKRWRIRCRSDSSASSEGVYHGHSSSSMESLSATEPTEITDLEETPRVDRASTTPDGRALPGSKMVQTWSHA